MGLLGHEQIRQGREGQHHGGGGEEMTVSHLTHQGTSEGEADEEGEHANGSLGKADILHGAVEAATVGGGEEEEDACVEHERLGQQQEEEAEEDGEDVGLLTDARDDVPLVLHGFGHTLVLIGLPHPQLGQDDDVEDAEEEERACHEGTLHCPRLLIAAEEDLEESGDDDEDAVGDDEGELGGDHLDVAEDFLLAGDEHLAVVHPRQQFVPSAEAGKHEEEDEEEPILHFRLGDIDGDAHQADEHHQLHPMDVPLERSRLPHLAVEIGFHHPRQEKQTAVERRHRRVGSELQKHQQRHKHDHRGGYLLGSAKARNPEPRIMFLGAQCCCIFSPGVSLVCLYHILISWA